MASDPPARSDLVVFWPRKADWACWSCAGSGDLLVMEGPGPMCLECADLNHLVYLPRGDTALSRRSRKESTLSAVVVRWSRTRKRYERQGLLVEEDALARAEARCLADEEARRRQRERAAERRSREDVELTKRMAAEIRRLFPRCPPDRADRIADHAAVRGSGRIGRSAAGRALDPGAVTAAVVASVRHEDSRYDELLMAGLERAEARAAVAADVEALLARWR